MINAAVLLDALVDKMRHIPDLVVEMEGDASRIRAFHDAYPEQTSWELVVNKAPAPSIIAILMSSVRSTMGQMEVYEHRISLYLRARRVPVGVAPAAVGCHRIFQLISDGVPTNGNGLPLLNYQIHADCHPMDVPTMERQTDAEGVNYWEVLVSFKELHA